MKTIEIEDQDYQAIAAAYGDVGRFIKTAAAKVRRTVRPTANRSFYDALAEEGFFENLASGPTDLSCNPAHLEGFGR